MSTINLGCVGRLVAIRPQAGWIVCFFCCLLCATPSSDDLRVREGKDDGDDCRINPRRRTRIERMGRDGNAPIRDCMVESLQSLGRGVQLMEGWVWGWVGSRERRDPVKTSRVGNGKPEERGEEGGESGRCERGLAGAPQRTNRMQAQVKSNNERTAQTSKRWRGEERDSRNIGGIGNMRLVRRMYI